MLGIESGICMKEQQSKFNHKEAWSDRGPKTCINRHSTSHTTHRLQSKSSNNASLPKIRLLRSRLHDLHNAQQAYEKKMKSCLLAIENEVVKKEEYNNSLGILITELKEEILKSKEDIELLFDYVCKKKSHSKIHQRRTRTPSKIMIDMLPTKTQTKISREKSSRPKHTPTHFNRPQRSILKQNIRKNMKNLKSISPNKYCVQKGEERKGSIKQIKFLSPYKRNFKLK